MGIIAICLVSIKGEIGCVVKNSFVSYQRITSIIETFKSTMEDIRLSCKSGNNSTLGGKRIEDCYPISQAIPLVIGSYRLLYLLVNDMYIIAIDLDHHSPFLALDVLNKVKEVIFATMAGAVSFSRIVEFKIKYYYSFRRCINGMEGVSTLDVPLRQIRLAKDPLHLYTDGNSLVDINSILHPGEVSAETREYTRDAWEAVLHFEGRIPTDAKKEIKANMKKAKLDEFFDIATELEGHAIPETATTPMADLIVDEEYDVETAMKPLNHIQATLENLPKTESVFTTNTLHTIVPASEAICEPYIEVVEKVAEETETVVADAEEDAEEEIRVETTDAIHVDVPGKAVAIDTTPGVTSAKPDEAEDEGEEVEELRVIQLDGQVTETLKIEYILIDDYSNLYRQGVENELKVHKLRGELMIKPVIPDGIPEGVTAAHVTITNTPGFTFECKEGIAKIVDDGETSKTFEIALPTVNKDEGTVVLTYEGLIPEQNIPCNANSYSSREGNVTSVKVEAHCNDCEAQSVIEGMTVLVAPPLLSNDPAIKRTFKIKPKGGFLKTSQKVRWTDQFMEGGEDYNFTVDITEPVDMNGIEASRDVQYCPCELKGKYNGIASGIRVVVPSDTDANLKCSYVKREILAVCKFALSFTP